ncbi:MAG: hypothetical protein HKO59_13525 [Phycisphaerales bacterium]|nr:hypothetical protein [Phycisphaerales bacterium]
MRLFIDLYGASAAAAVAGAVVSGTVAAIVMVGLTVLWHGTPGGWRHRLARLQTLLWLVAALVPGTIAGVAIEAAYNQPAWLGGVLADGLYRTPAVLVLAHLTRFGFIAALFAWWCATREPRTTGDLRRLDGVTSGWALWRAGGPRITTAAACVVATVAVLSFGEITVTARVQPPGSGALSVALLNAMHYQRPETVVNAAVLMMLGALAAAAIIAVAWVTRGRRPLRRSGLVGVFAVAGVMLTGCRDPGEAGPLPVDLVFGSNGTALGQFSYPRCIDVDRERGRVYVVDKTARVQRYGLDGTPQIQWQMPAREQGKPTGVSVAPDGRVFVADTHYYRIIAYTADGEEVLRFGSYGKGPGEFIYPTDIAFGPEGRLYVAEYGGHDRIQVFAPDGTYEFEFGSLGNGPGEFSRPQSIEFDPGGTELFITDACNHRILVTDPRGRPLRQIGAPGNGLGELHYPYGLTFLSDGTVLVAEFGNNRLQRFDPDGTPRGLYGTVGASAGALRYPWGVSSVGGSVYVLDSGNNRVQRMPEP